MDSGADPTLRAKDGRVPLCCAAGAGHFQVLSYLFKKEHNALSLMEDKSVRSPSIQLTNAYKTFDSVSVGPYGVLQTT